MKRLLLACTTGLLVTRMSVGILNAAQQTACKTPQVKKIQLKRQIPRDGHSFTQGLLVHKNYIYESTGLYGKSGLLMRHLKSGMEVRRMDISNPRIFAEGLAFFSGHLYQLTWQNGQALVYEPRQLQRVAQLNYRGEGWGLTADAQSLWMSDGSEYLQQIKPDLKKQEWRVIQRVHVREGKQSVKQLNELEYIPPYIYANIWQTQRIIGINPQTGCVEIALNLPASWKPAGEEKVANGIAYHAASNTVYLTGKLWPFIYQVTW